MYDLDRLAGRRLPNSGRRSQRSWRSSALILSDVEIPRSEAPGETDKFVLFDSRRSYVEQMDFYNAWRAGDDGDGS